MLRTSPTAQPTCRKAGNRSMTSRSCRSISISANRPTCKASTSPTKTSTAGGRKRPGPKTSQPTLPVQGVLPSIARAGDTILSIHVTSKLSGTFDSAVTAARELAHQFHC